MGKNKIILIIIGILILGGFVFYFNYWQKQIQQKAEVDQCKNYPKVEGEIPCQEVKDIVLAKYPGDIKYIEKSNVSVQTSKPPEIQTTQKDVWLVGVHLNNPSVLPSPQTLQQEQATSSEQTSEIEVVVDRYVKNILFFQTECPKCSQ